MQVSATFIQGLAFCLLLQVEDQPCSRFAEVLQECRSDVAGDTHPISSNSCSSVSAHMLICIGLSNSDPMVGSCSLT